MSKKDKLLKRLLSRPKDFTWDELVSLLARMGYELFSGSGSRRRFVDSKKQVISLHEPHPQKVLKSYMVDIVISSLREHGAI